MKDTEKLNAVNMSISSSLPYKINSYLESNIENSDKTKVLNPNILNIKDSEDEEYKTFSMVNDAITLKDSCPATESTVHKIDLKLSAGSYETDIYKTVIKIEVEQE